MGIVYERNYVGVITLAYLQLYHYPVILRYSV